MDPDVSERFDRLENNLDRLADIVSSLVQVARSHEERLDRLTEAQARTDEVVKLTQEGLGVLIRMMDDWIRKNPRNGNSQSSGG